MEKVQKYPCLYYQFCEDFEEKYVNLSSFKVIGDKFGLPPHKVKKRYKSIRISFTRYLKKNQHNPSGSRRADLQTPEKF